MKRQIALELIEKFPNLSTRELARLLSKETGDNFETSRAMINRHRKKERVKQNSYKIPKTEAEDPKPFLIKQNDILILSDIHIPYHSVVALKAAVEYSNCKAVLLNGDTMDCLKLSSFLKDHRKRDIPQELEDTRQFLQWLRWKTNAVIYWKDGNHEYRFKSYMFRRSPELLGIHEYEIPVLLHFGELGINYIPGDKTIIKAGKLNILHGHEYGGSGSYSYPAKRMYDKAQANILFGHFHRTSEYKKTNMNGEILGSWSTGCLAGLHPDWRPINDWNHGFAIVHVNPSGDFEVHNKTIDNGKVI